MAPDTARPAGRWLMRIALTFTWVFVGLACQSGQAARADEIDRYIQQERKLYGIPAIVMGVIRDGKLVDARATGLANVELNVKAGTQQVFEIGSISKQFTAYAILMLRDQGKLELDAPLGRYLPDLAELPTEWAKVSLHRLLTHTSGLPDLEEAFGYGIYRETPSDADFLRRIAALPVRFAPGEQWQYSNTNYWLLALVIERLADMSHAEFMQKNIFAPLGMTQTRSALPAQLLPGRAAGYRNVGLVLENRDATQPHTGRGLGDISSTLADMARWEREQLAPKLVSAATAGLARQPVVLNDGTTEPYGYGWSTEKILPLATLQHDGQMAGFTATYIRVPERRLAVVVFTNCYGAPSDALARFILRQSEPALRTPRLTPVPDIDSPLTQKARAFLTAAASARTQWREEWFSPEQWRAIQPWLADVEDVYLRLGSLRSLTLVGREQEEGAIRLTYRAVYPGASRLVTLRFDAQGRISGMDAADE